MDASIRLPEEPTSDLESALAGDLRRTDEVEWLPSSQWRLHLLGFGHVTRGDAVKVVEVLREKVGEFAPPTLHVAGVQPLIFDGDDSVWAMLGGDLDDVTAVAKSMPRWVHPLGFTPDRRRYRPAIRLGRVTRSTALAYLEDLVGRLGEYQGPAWNADQITVGRVRGGSFEVFDVAMLEGRLGNKHELPAAPVAAPVAVPQQASGVEAERPHLAVG
jgi:hypothetical protein